MTGKKLQLYKVYLVTWTLTLGGLLIWLFISKDKLAQIPYGYTFPILILLIGNTVGNLMRGRTRISNIEW
jgi:hypothetical protein